MEIISFNKFVETQVVQERVLNLFNDNEKHLDVRKQYALDVWNMLQVAYADIGGIKGNGFGSVEDMIEKIPFWKLVRKNDKIVSVVMYKGKQGRKMVAIASDGTEAGKLGLGTILKDDLDPSDVHNFKSGSRAYFEISDKPLSLLKKVAGMRTLKSMARSFKEVERIQFEDEIVRPPKDDPHFERFPELREFFYQRELGGKMHTKIMFGYDGQMITR